MHCVLICQKPTVEVEFPILRQEVESAFKTLTCGKVSGVDNVPAELITHGGQPVVEVLHAIYNKIWYHHTDERQHSTVQ